MDKLSLSDIELAGKRVLMRVDFNVPFAEGLITDDTRIRAALQSIQYVQDRGGRLILASHMGRPGGSPDSSLSLQPVSRHLQKLLGKQVGFSRELVGPETERIVENLSNGDVVVLENLRFDVGEESNAPEFASKLASLCDIYVNDAFGAVHRAHASTVGVTHFVSTCAAGFLVEREVEILSRALVKVGHPYVAIVGGSKISGKIELIENFLKIADEILIGGAMAYTFFRAMGFGTGKSLVEANLIELASRLLNSAEKEGARIRLPKDHVVARDFDGTGLRTVSVEETAEEEIGLDIGDETIHSYKLIIDGARTILWNGPMGVFENSKFEKGTLSIARAIASVNAFSIIGGGDSATAVARSGVRDRISHISTGGGASLAFLSGRRLPGIEVLTDGVDS